MIDLQEQPIEIFEKIKLLQETNNETLGYLIYGALAERMAVAIHKQDVQTIKAVNLSIMKENGVDAAVIDFVLREFQLGDFIEAMKEDKLTYEIAEMDAQFNKKFVKDYRSQAAKIEQFKGEITVTLGKRRAAQRGRNQGNDSNGEELSCTYSEYHDRAEQLK